MISALLAVLAIGSAPQALRDTIRNLPVLGQPTPWIVIIAVAIGFGYLALDGGRKEEKQPSAEDDHGRRALKSMSDPVEDVCDHEGKILWSCVDEAFQLNGWLGRVQATAPTAIVAVNDGIVVAGIVARNLGIEEIHYVVHDYHRETRKVVKSTVKRLRDQDFSGKTILLIDDQQYSGGSLDAAYDELTMECSVDKSLIKRAALLRFDPRPAHASPLDILEHRVMSGGLRIAPWSYTEAHGRRYED